MLLRYQKAGIAITIIVGEGAAKRSARTEEEAAPVRELDHHTEQHANLELSRD